jgi:hypothetical protein
MTEEIGVTLSAQPSEEVMAMATEDLYRNNLFRILAVPIHAGPMEVRQRLKKLEMQRKLGLSAQGDSSAILPFSPPPSSEAAAKAMEKMNDPVARFLDEFFWFSAPADDVALAALGRGNVADARALWQQQAAASSGAFGAIRNLAVLEHVLALESPNPDGTMSAALAAWNVAWQSEDFWDSVRVRISEVNDARLTTGFVRRLRRSLPSLLLLIFARQAVAACEHGDSKKCAALLDTIRRSPYGPEFAEEAIREALKPLRARISAAVASARNQWTRAPQHGDRILRELHEAVRPLLSDYDRLVENDLARQSVHDEVGGAMNEAEIAYSKATNNWTDGARLLALAQEVAMGQRLRDLIAKNIKIDEDNAKNGNDWCAPGYWDLPPDVVEAMQKARHHADGGNFDAALDILLALDKRAGFPLVRASAYCISIKAIRLFNNAIGELNAIRPIYKKVIDNLPDRWSLPTPQTPSFMMPPCLACGSKYYNSWVKFSCRGQNNLFMCTSCSTKDDADLADRKRTFAAAMPTVMDHIALAARLDPKDPGIRQNRDNMTKVAAELGYSGRGNADALAKTLAKAEHRRAVAAVGSAADTCVFCGRKPGEASAALTVPMHGPVTRMEFLLGEGILYDYADVTVPRCAGCRREHAEWPKRVETWHDAALRTASLGHFPELCAARTGARNAAEAAAKQVAAAGAAVETAESALAQAVQNQGYLSRLLRRPNPERDAAVSSLDAARRQQAAAVGRSEQAKAGLERAQAALLQARTRAVADNKAANPMPGLPEGIVPEDRWTEVPLIAAQQRNGWSFGESSAQDGGGRPAPKGVVCRQPVLAPLPPI